MKQSITINNRDFNLNGIIAINSVKNMKYKTLYDCYDRPSATKQQIYDDWLNWLPNKDDIMYIRSYNTNFFTLWADVEWEGKEYYLEIYPTRNEAWVIA